MIKNNNKTHLKLANTKLQRPQQGDQKMGIVQSFKGTNISYGFEGLKLPFFSKSINKNIQVVPDLYVGGKKFQSLQECKKAHRQLIWFTYKKNFKISLRFHSDVGWGCLIRVGQMALAEALRRYLSQTIGNVSNSYIITPFLQSESNAKYNVTKFVTKAQFLYSKKPGQWFSITEVAMILQDLHEQHPLKCSQNLKVSVCVQSINIQNLSDILEGSTLKDSPSKLSFSRFAKGQEKQFYLHKKTYLSITKSQNCYTTQNKNHIFLVLIARFGQNQVPIKTYNSLLQFMKLPTFLGGLGGIPKKARFLTGIYEDKISYLDPHYVEDKVQQINLENQLSKFSCKQYRYMSRQELDTNIGLCFYLKSLQDIQTLIKCIDQINSCDKRPYFRYQTSDNPCQQIEITKEQKQQFEKKLSHEQSFSDLNSSGSMESSFFMD